MKTIRTLFFALAVLAGAVACSDQSEPVAPAAAPNLAPGDSLLMTTQSDTTCRSGGTLGSSGKIC